MSKRRQWFILRPWQRHGLVLLIGGLAYISIGVAFMNDFALPTEHQEALLVGLNIVPLCVWGAQFIAAGSLAVLSSRWPEFNDSWGYMGLTGLTSAWASIYFLGYILDGASTSNLAYGFVWSLVAFLWWAISGLMNPERRSVIRDGPN